MGVNTSAWQLFLPIWWLGHDCRCELWLQSGTTSQIVAFMFEFCIVPFQIKFLLLTGRHNWECCSWLWGEELLVSPASPSPAGTYEPQVKACFKYLRLNLFTVAAAHLFAPYIQQVSAVQEVLVLRPWHHRFRQLAQVQFEQRRHRVDICVTVETTFSERDL